MKAIALILFLLLTRPAFAGSRRFTYVYEVTTSPPGDVEIPLANAEVRTADGTTVASSTQLGSTVFHANEPGLYRPQRNLKDVRDFLV